MIVENHDFMRLIIPHICHTSFSHLFINMLGFYRMGHIMEVMLKNRYIYIILFTGLLSCLIHTLIGIFGIHVYNDYSVYNSSVLFSLMIVLFYKTITIECKSFVSYLQRSSQNTFPDMWALMTFIINDDLL